MAIAEQLKKEAVSQTIISTEFYKKERTALFVIKANQKLALSFKYHPHHQGLFLVPISKINLNTREKPWPIFGIKEAVIKDVAQVGFDRVIRLIVELGGVTKTIIIEAIGTNGNIWLLGDDDKIEATLRKKEYRPGESYFLEPIPDKLNPLELSVTALKESAINFDGDFIKPFLEKKILGFSHTLAKECLKRSQLDFTELMAMTDENWTTLIKTIESISQSFANAETGYLYHIGGKYETYPFKLSTVDDQPEKFKSFSIALMSMSERKQEDISRTSEENNIKSAVNKALKRLVKRYENVSKDIDGAQNYEDYKKYGELLQINFDKLKKGMEQIELEDVYTSDNILIKLDPALSPNENAEIYFRKHRKGREGLELLLRRQQITKDEIDELKKIIDELENDLESAQKRYQAEISALLPKEGVKSESFERLPYKEYQLSTGLTIYVGRDGSDNDRTTFDFARPYELWFHAQQCPGSHVVMKYPNKNFEPSKLEIDETAAIAAFHSKARNDSLVPVIYTERKYVRKPRKAKPGLVTVDREKSVMVVPTEPLRTTDH